MPLPALIDALLSSDAYSHPVAKVRLIETHISWVLLAGDFAYKVKKPIDLGFLDFSSLDKRHFCCEEEIRLNQRLAPDIYLDVMPVTGSEIAPKIGGDGPALEWAVRMRAFPADSTLDQEPVITALQIDAIADRIARFHVSTEPAPEDSLYGAPESVMQPILENFMQLRELFPDQANLSAKIESLTRWSEAEGSRLLDHFRRRKVEGWVRDCHGDLHLGNIAWFNGAPLIFDCIEFNPGLRHIDITSEVAFLFMDLIARGHAGLAWRFINRWLEHTGDYAGLKALRFYLVYRAVVRAKVAGILAKQAAQTDSKEARRYLELAETLGQKPPVQLTLMHGHSGSGKTWASQKILESSGAIILRSDVERKRLFGLDALGDSSTIPGGIYSPKASRLTLGILLEYAEMLLAAGYSVIVDATFLARSWRDPFFALARKIAVPVRIVSMNVDAETMRNRIIERIQQANDASEAGLEVLESQLKNAEPLSESELQFTQLWPASG